MDIKTDPTFAAFHEALLSDDKMSVVDYFNGMTEKERDRHAKYCYEYCKAVEKAYLGEPLETTNRYNSYGGIVGATLTHSTKGVKLRDIWGRAKSAVVATASWSTLKDLNWFYDIEEVEAILRDRRPEWTIDFLAKIIESVDLHIEMKRYWEPYRRFIREGIVKSKRLDSITELMFAVATGSRYEQEWNLKQGKQAPDVVIWLKNDPDLIEHELWHIFEIERFRQNWCYTTHDRFGKWKDTFCELILDGTIPKEKVLAGCFAALTRPFTDHQSKWFAQLLERLVDKLPISEKELAADRRFLDLLDHSHPSPRGVGLKLFERLVKTGTIELDGMAARLTSILRETAKTKPKKAITLLDTMARKRPDLRGEIFSVLPVALEHEAVEIQNLAMDLFLGFNAFDDQKVAEHVLRRFASMASSVRKRLPIRTAVAMASTAVDEADNGDLIPLRELLVPIKSFDELLDSATRIIESANDPDEIERFLDGISRLGADKPKDFDKMTAPLLKRAVKMLGTEKNIYNSDGAANRLAVFPPFTGENIAADCFYIVLAWLTGEMPTHTKIETKGKTSLSEVSILGRRWIHWASSEKEDGCPAYRIFSDRAKTVAEQILHGFSSQRLSTPIHHGGWINPTVFVQRLVEAVDAKTEHDDIDRVLALLRLDFQGREDALKELDAKIKKRDEYIQAVRYALGAAKCKIGKTAHYWIAAGRSRTPLDDIDALETRFPSLGPDAGEAAVYSIEKKNGYQIEVRSEPASKKKPNAALFPTVALHASNTYHYMNVRQENPWKLSVWPSNPDPAIGAAIQSHFEYRDDNYDTGLIPYIEILQKSDISIRKIGAAAIFVGFGMKYAAIPMASTDTMILAISQDRLKMESALDAVGELLATGLMVPSRWLKPLKTVAEQSPKHALFVRNLLEGMVARLDPKTVGGFLELLHEVAIAQEQAIQDKTCLKYLKSLTGTGKAAKLAKKLLEL